MATQMSHLSLKNYVATLLMLPFYQQIITCGWGVLNFRTNCKNWGDRLIHFRFHSGSYNNGTGFEIQYSAIGACGGNFNVTNGTLLSPAYPKNYPDNADCTYTISQPNGTLILLNIVNIDIRSNPSCSDDMIEIRDGPSNDSPVLKKLCGNIIDDPILSTQNQLWIKWV